MLDDSVRVNVVLDDLTIGPLIGRGRRSRVYGGELRGESVVVKVYERAAIRKYRRRYGVSIAQFEHDRNTAFSVIDELRPFVARPIAVGTSLLSHLSPQRLPDGLTGCHDFSSEFFVQQRIDGVDLRELLDETGRLPANVLDTIDAVVETASRNGLFDIDMSPSNFRMQPDGNGWRPVLFDFNMMPQYQHAPNPFIALLYRTGLRHPAHRDRWMLERLRTWPD